MPKFKWKKFGNPLAYRALNSLAQSVDDKQRQTFTLYIIVYPLPNKLYPFGSIRIP
jgi:hypothetical protein